MLLHVFKELVQTCKTTTLTKSEQETRATETFNHTSLRLRFEIVQSVHSKTAKIAPPLHSIVKTNTHCEDQVKTSKTFYFWEKDVNHNSEEKRCENIKCFF